MTLFDVQMDTMTPSKLVNPKALAAVVRDFFGRSQLSQFMDQINPLAELTHKRRLSALGPGGLNRDRAGFEVRDVHPSHYGRICPIETPEGPNIGLINSLGAYARINEFGFIETPYRPCKEGNVAEKIDYLTADQEENHYIAQANNPIDEKGHFKGPKITVRYRGEFIEVEPEKATLMDVSPKQLVSVAAALIPFLEHDDANRALMGSNMQRQGVPLLEAEAPFVGTGMEAKAARDSRAVIVADGNGTVAASTADVIIVTKDGELPCKEDKFLADPIKSVQTEEEKGTFVYPLRKFGRSNAGTCINQRPLVKNGQKIKKGDVIADGPCTDNGELALGKNMLVAFMPWNGYNFEDAIVISRRIVKEDIYTSIHIEDFEVIARDTKLGPEEITRDIPNVGDEALKNLDSQGVVRIGAEVKPGDILVGKITPKSETELAPEERLLRAIFGEKAADVKDTSLRVPSGCAGIVMDVRVANRTSGAESDKEKLSPSEYKKHIKQIEEDYRQKKEELSDQLTDRLEEIIGEDKLDNDIVNGQTGEIIVAAGKKVSKAMLRRVAENYDSIEMDASPMRNKLFDAIQTFEQKFSDADTERERNLDKIESSESAAESNVVKQVRVFVAAKRKLSVGDKMAGRHGNKGVVATIVPEEDMPFLENGVPVDICLNPLGVPSRMNVGQVLETHLGIAAKALGLKIATPVFDGIHESKIMEFIKDAKKQPGYEWMGLTGKSRLYDGRTGDPYTQDTVVGYIYMLKLGHLVADKIHARAVGPYSLVTQQPLGGKAQYGGQRFGEMEVWALEAYGAAYTLQELLTVKSDDVQGRTRIYEQIVKGDHALQAGTPESFNVLIKEMQSLGLDVKVHKRAGSEEQQAELEGLERFATAAGF
jgi:DNA-directed RNA polymerase subunit beta